MKGTFVLGVISLVLVAANSVLKGGADDPDLPARIGLGGVLVLGLLFHFYRRIWRTDDRLNDYRVIAEGLRVQTYWAAAGIGLPVASRYVNRRLGELQWIRGALRSAGWIGGQSSYFTNTVAKFRKR